jgi:hypothetical protein
MTPVAFVEPLPVSRSGKDATGNVGLALLVPGGWMSKLSTLPDWRMFTKFVPGTDAMVI